LADGMAFAAASKATSAFSRFFFSDGSTTRSNIHLPAA